MLADIVDVLACPRCGEALTLADGAVRCRSGHAYDVAKQGYVNLLGAAAPANADTAAMVAARADFLAAGHYAPIADSVAARLGDGDLLVDAGAGTGWYLARALAAHPGRRGLALDVSPHACRRAARCHPRAGAAVADTWAGLPVRSGRADAVMAVFAPRNLTDFARVLRPGGVLVVAAPEPDHIAEARTALGLLGLEEDKQARLLRSAAGLFDAVGSEVVRYGLDLGAADVARLVDMGPNAFHTHERPAAMRVTVAVRVTWFRRPAG